MALDLLKDNVDAVWLVARLCEEAGICADHLLEFEREIHSATYEVGKGLIVMDEDGKKFRLQVTAEPIK